MSTVPVAATLHRRWAADLDPATLYALLRVRVEVFVVEQRCPYPELDGRDLEPLTRHHWLGGSPDASAPADREPEPVLGCVRLLEEPDAGYRVGRLCVARERRGSGLGRQLMNAVLAEVGDADCVLDAQSSQVGFYGAHGFVPAGAAYDWHGVEHVPMRRVRREPVS